MDIQDSRRDKMYHYIIFQAGQPCDRHSRLEEHHFSFFSLQQSSASSSCSLHLPFFLSILRLFIDHSELLLFHENIIAPQVLVQSALQPPLRPSPCVLCLREIANLMLYVKDDYRDEGTGDCEDVKGRAWQWNV